MKVILYLSFVIILFSGCDSFPQNEDIYKYRVTTDGFNIWKYTNVILQEGNCINFISNTENDTNTTFCGSYQIEYLKGKKNGK